MSHEFRSFYGRTERKGEWGLGVPEASGIAQLVDGAFLVVDDERGIFHVAPDGERRHLDVGLELLDLEGICVTPEGDHAYVLAESNGSVWRFAVRDGELVDRERIGRLPRIGRKRRFGWEGLAYVPAGTFVESAELVAVHQAKPRRLGFFALDTLEPRMVVRLPRAARNTIGKLNDVTVDSEGRIFVLSGKCGRIVELRLDGAELRLVAVYRIRNDQDDVPEGITIGRQGQVWICTDGEGMVRELALGQREAAEAD